MKSIALYIVISTVGIGISIYLGYRDAKKTDPAVCFDTNLFYQSLLRALPVIAIASVALATSGITVQGIITALTAAAGSDVVLKRVGIKQKTTNNTTPT